MGSFNFFYQFPILIFQPFSYNLQDYLSNSCLPCSFQIAFSCSQVSNLIQKNVSLPLLITCQIQLDHVLKKEGGNTACDSSSEIQWCRRYFPIQYAYFQVRHKWPQRKGIWTLKYIPFWQLERSTLSKTISARLQHMTHNPKEPRSGWYRNITKCCWKYSVCLYCNANCLPLALSLPG